MIAVKKSSRNIPNSLREQESPKNKDEIKSGKYSAPDVLEKLKNIYHSKCSYCESFTSSPEIEHYRPKKQVKGIARKDHNGYYWLAYEWSNLLLACHDCNRNGVKGNHFPIEGVRVFEPNLENGKIDVSANKFESDYLQKEQALFLNPEAENFNPFRYFKFDKTGLFEPNPDEGTYEYRQAKTTIDIVDFNGDRLYSNVRKKQISAIFSDLKNAFKLVLEKEVSKEGFKKMVFHELDKIKGKTKSHKEYSFFWTYFYENFPFYVNSYFKGKHQIPFLKFYKEHRNKT